MYETNNAECQTPLQNLKLQLVPLPAGAHQEWWVAVSSLFSAAKTAAKLRELCSICDVREL